MSKLEWYRTELAKERALLEDLKVATQGPHRLKTIADGWRQEGGPISETHIEGLGHLLQRITEIGPEAKTFNLFYSFHHK